MEKHHFAIASGLLLGGLFLGGCTARFGSSSSTYASIVSPSLTSVLQESSPMECNWTGTSGGPSYRSGGASGWTTDESWSGRFDCDPADLEALAEGLFAGMCLDIYGSGFLIESDETLTHMEPFVAGASPAIEFLIHHYNGNSSGTVAFQAFPNATGNYSYEIDFVEESR